jgi:hypothetical protein
MRWGTALSVRRRGPAPSRCPGHPVDRTTEFGISDAGAIGREHRSELEVHVAGQLACAAARVLKAFYGTDRVSFTSVSDGLPGVTRRFARFSAAAREAALSRLYAGIHFRSANEDGLAAGIAIGEWVVHNFLQPNGNRPRASPAGR